MRERNESQVMKGQAACCAEKEASPEDRGKEERRQRATESQERGLVKQGASTRKTRAVMYDIHLHETQIEDEV